MNEHADPESTDPTRGADPRNDAELTPWSPATAPLSAAPGPHDGGHFDDTSAEGVTAPLDAPTEPARPRGRRVLALGLAATVLLTIGAGGGAVAAISLQNAQQTTSAQVAPNGSTGGGTTGGGTTSGGGSTSGQGGTATGPGAGTGFGNGFGSRNGFGRSGSGSSSSSSGTAATTAQTVGVVTIVTTLGYESGEAAGTGIILNASGRILTNNHVIDGATAIKVTDESTGTSYTAKVVGTDSTDDVAVLQLEGASGLTPATIASGAAKAGDSVTAVGNAGGTGTLSAADGSITALEQSITTAAEGSSASEKLTGLIETDADVVAGDSGGPLKNADGAVIGIDTAASSGTADVTGYAIPIGDALDIAGDIVAGKDSATITLGYPAFLGVSVSAQGATAGTGAVIAQVIAGTPAAKTDLAAGDTVTAVDGTSITSAEELTSTLQERAPGDSVTITYTDTDGASHSVSVTLTTGPAN